MASHLFSRCACVNGICFGLVCTSTYRIEQNKAHNLEMSVSARTQAQLSNLHRTKTDLMVPNGGST